MSRPVKKKIKKRNNQQENKWIKIVFISFLFAAVAAILFFYFSRRTKQQESFTNDKYTVRGVDLSHHNPIIDWAEVKDRNNIRFVYLKATGGIKHTDRNYQYNYKSAKDNNLKTGSYHFYLFGISGKQQARHFIKNIQFVSGDLYPAIDVEHSKDNVYSTDTAYIRLIVQELKELEKGLYEYLGIHPIIYTNKECYKLYVEGKFNENPIWMCNLHEEPKGIDNWVIWQFSHKGALDGIAGDIDLNYFRYPYEDLTRIMLP